MRVRRKNSAKIRRGSVFGVPMHDKPFSLGPFVLTSDPFRMTLSLWVTDTHTKNKPKQVFEGLVRSTSHMAGRTRERCTREEDKDASTLPRK